MSAVVQAARELFGNIVPGAPPPECWRCRTRCSTRCIWVVVILVVFVPLSVRTYRRTASR